MTHPFRHWCHEHNLDPEDFDSRWSYMDELNRLTSAITRDALRGVDQEDPGVQQACSAMESLATTIRDERGRCSNHSELEALWIHCSGHWFEPIQRVQRALAEANLHTHFSEQASSPESIHALVRAHERAAGQYFDLMNTVDHGATPYRTVKLTSGR
ncbi:hypothetical protein [Thioalkalivibrio sp. ALE12]|uniref:hypothetical protein n=1 Tax=Thioalkalivibrio sp. ALE12 TaxID=1158170 RepID=UPI00039FB512|nr:hypothetical protein [Thioalkalivibrio sp. ALE12]